MNRKVERGGVRTGYDLWADTYHYTPNPVVALRRPLILVVQAQRPA